MQESWELNPWRGQKSYGLLPSGIQASQSQSPSGLSWSAKMGALSSGWRELAVRNQSAGHAPKSSSSKLPCCGMTYYALLWHIYWKAAVWVPCQRHPQLNLASTLGGGKGPKSLPLSGTIRRWIRNTDLNKAYTFWFIHLTFKNLIFGYCCTCGKISALGHSLKYSSQYLK